MLKVLGTPLYQWDIGRRIVATKGATEIHIAPKGQLNAAVLSIADEGTCEIPNIYLQKPCVICAWSVNTVADEMCVLDAASWHVMPRPKPDDYVYTQTEIKTFETLREEIMSYVDERLADIDGGAGGTSDYEKLENLPKIEGTTIIGSQTFSDFGCEDMTRDDIAELFEGVSL